MQIAHSTTHLVVTLSRVELRHLALADGGPRMVQAAVEGNGRYIALRPAATGYALDDAGEGAMQTRIPLAEIGYATTDSLATREIDAFRTRKCLSVPLPPTLATAPTATVQSEELLTANRRPVGTDAAPQEDVIRLEGIVGRLSTEQTGSLTRVAFVLHTPDNRRHNCVAFGEVARQLKIALQVSKRVQIDAKILSVRDEDMENLHLRLRKATPVESPFFD